MIPVKKLADPFGCTLCSFETIRPTSVVKVTRTSKLNKFYEIIIKLYILRKRMIIIVAMTLKSHQIFLATSHKVQSK